MTKEELLEELRSLSGWDGDVESRHIEADRLLIAYLDDPDIEEVWDKIGKWYA